jgi:Protein of unknown function (DUF4065)
MLKKLIKYFVYKTKGHVTKTQLVKFLYLSDLYSVKWTGKKLTNLDWYYYLRGPWNEDIDKALSEMEGEEVHQDKNDSVILIKLGKKSEKIEDLELPVSLELLLGNIAREWAGSGEKQQELLDYVYSTAPMEYVKEKHRPEEKVPLDLGKEREKLLAELKY